MQYAEEAKALLFESGEDEERLIVECSVGNDGAMHIVQISEGPLTQWCFEEEAHTIDVGVETDGVAALVDHFALDDRRQLPAVLQLRYAGYDASRRVRDLMGKLSVPYRVEERPIVR